MKDRERASPSALRSTRTVCSCSVLSFYGFFFPFSHQIEEQNMNAAHVYAWTCFLSDVFSGTYPISLFVPIWIKSLLITVYPNPAKAVVDASVLQNTQMYLGGVFLIFDTKLTCPSTIAPLQRHFLEKRGNMLFYFCATKFLIQNRSMCDVVYLYRADSGILFCSVLTKSTKGEFG